MTLTTAQQMALAVLNGDLVAARALADCLINDLEGTIKEVLPSVKRIRCDISRIRVIVYLHENLDRHSIDEMNFEQSFRDWINGDGPLTMGVYGVDRIELYELPSKIVKERKKRNNKKPPADDPTPLLIGSQIPDEMEWPNQEGCQPENRIR